MIVREPQLAGTWYPGDAHTLGRDVDGYIASAVRLESAKLDRLKAVIAPHAGYRYSGPIAGSAYAQVAAIRDRIHRVVLIGPSHRVAFSGLAVSGANQFRTPLGDVPIDREAVQSLMRLPYARELEAAHAEEHSLEIHLPFLQRALDDFTLVPVVTGDASADQVAEALTSLWGGAETLIVISTDLTHFLDYDTACRIDAATSQMIIAGNPDAIGDNQACGRVGLKGLLEVGRRHDIDIDLLDLRNSGDTSDARARVVGYGSWAAMEAADAHGSHRILALGHGRQMMDIAWSAIHHGLVTGKELDMLPDDVPAALKHDAASFVTLRKAAELRGCIGSAEAYGPLVDDIARNAFKAAFHDPRFPPLSEAETPMVDIEISLLSRPVSVSVVDEADLIDRLRPGIDGLILADSGQRALFLPAVWQSLAEPKDFVRHLKRKAGWDDGYWSDTMTVSTFSAIKVAPPFPGDVH